MILLLAMYIALGVFVIVVTKDMWDQTKDLD
jgi:hypothetical protein